AGLFLLFRGYQPDWRSVTRSAIFKSDTFRRYLQINRDIFIRTICLVFALAYFTAQSAEFGDDLLAVNTILMQLLLILAYGTDGFAFAAESLIGKFIGERNRKSLREVIRLSFFWSMGLGAITSCFYYIFYRDLIFIFTDKTHLTDLAMPFIGWVAIAPLINGFSYIWDGIFIGATKTREMLISMIMSVLVFFLPSYYITKDVFGNHSIWFALTIFMVMRGLTLSIFYFTKFKKQLN
ncbi:MAG: MATE family efflux transporter, partial [Ignavibacteriae bacterium]|nr:MATE family efflux transporter [Ignavibacteriota bacterium]